MLKAIVILTVLAAITHSSYGQVDVKDTKDTKDNFPPIFGQKNCRCVLPSQCINYLYVMAFTSNLLHSQSNTDHQIRLRAKGIESTRILPDLPNGNFEQELGDLWKLSIEDFFNFTTCITLYDIESISLVAASDDGWNIDSIVTFAVINSDCYELISSDHSVDRWVDGNGDDDHKEFILSLKTFAGPCIRYLYVMAYTSNLTNSQTRDDHKIELKADGLAKIAIFSNFPDQSRGYLWKFSLADDFGFTGCIRKKDIQGITILADDTDGWNIDSIVTYVAGNNYDWKLSSVDLDVNRWIDQNSDPSRKQFELNLLI